ncbi:hypothetical protein R0131_14545 [Clostridium sp. AL.422]|uniref:hypothetical protein n=1 Tax=Clostridium TaxID=1485 RepID=UPI00293DD4EF|nr:MULTISPECIES: hypothetical protein [unclassified Clostridium]MDV4152045.1 hypothetical protein [Clostridium sp. AL.422]
MIKLFDCHNIIDESYNRSHIIHKFKLSKECNSIKIIFEYNPKFIKNDIKAKEIIQSTIDKQVVGIEKEKEINNWQAYKKLKNLLTLSIYDAIGFRGAAHRQDQHQEHIIRKNDASPGMIEGIIPKGEFTIKVSAHAMVTDECNYNIKVYDMEEENE